MQSTVQQALGGFAADKSAQPWPIDDLGQRVEPNPHFDDWDQTPHAYFTIGVGHVALGDVIMSTHQVEGFGRANQRGTDAVRLDLQFVVTRSLEPSARVILPVDHQIEVKRYSPNVMGKHRWAWVKIHDADAVYREPDGTEKRLDNPAGLVPDYGSDTRRCGCGVADGNPPTDVNGDGYEGASTICDACVDSWETDHEVVRHLA